MSGGSSRDDIADEIAANRYRAQADDAYRHALGAPAPGRFADESPGAYRVRLLSGLTNFSPRWRGATPSDLAQMRRAGGLGVIEGEVFHDAIEHAHRSTGPLREIQTPDRSGRLVSRFYGNPEECWGQFKLPVRRVAKFNVPGGDL